MGWTPLPHGWIEAVCGAGLYDLVRELDLLFRSARRHTQDRVDGGVHQGKAATHARH